MEYKITQIENKNILECLQDGGEITNEQDAVDLIGLCGYEKAGTALVYSSNLPEEFYNLKTGLAGKILLKFSNYSVILVAVIPSEKIGSGYFYEMVLETNRGNAFRVFPNRDEALNWIKRA